MLTVYIDGASRGNPGEAGIGIIFKSGDGSTLFSAAGYAGKMTNNQAEYHALIAALTKLKKSPAMVKPDQSGETHILIQSDSELIVKQLKGEYRVKEPELKKLYQQVHTLLRAIQGKITFKHIRREQNRDADRLANIGIDSKIHLTL
jgi:ribonuclease HI